MDKIIIFISVILILGVLLGWFSNEAYKHFMLKKTIAGLWIPGLEYKEAKDIANKMDGVSNWVCINTLNMDYQEIIKTCTHEAAHEVFAEQCSKDIEKCLEVVKK